MARARNIKPGFFKNCDLIELPVETRLLFAGLWTIADREGRLQDRPRQIKVDIFPADDFDINKMLDELVVRGFITRYKVGDKAYIQIHNWHTHQKPHPKESASIIPEVPKIIEEKRTSAARKSRVKVDPSREKPRQGNTQDIASQAIPSFPSDSLQSDSSYLPSEEEPAAPLPKSPPYALVSYFEEQHELVKGTKPVPSKGGKKQDLSLAKTLCDTLGYECTRELVPKFLAGNDFADEAGYSFGVFYSQVNKLMTGGKGGKNRGNSSQSSKQDDGFDGIRAFAKENGVVGYANVFTGANRPENPLPEARAGEGAGGDNARNSGRFKPGSAHQGNQGVLLGARGDLSGDEHSGEDTEIRPGPQAAINGD